MFGAMKSLIIYLLVLSTFSAPMAWALDVHELALDGHAETHAVHDAHDQIGVGYQADNNSKNSPHDDHNHDLNHSNTEDLQQTDHCDHGIAHLTSLVSSEPANINLNFKTIRRHWNDTFTTVALNPPYKPPIL